MITAIAGRTVITGLTSGDGFMMTSAQKRPDRTATMDLWLPVGRMLEQSMKDTCKSWLQVITACLGLSATTWGQSFELASPGANSPSAGMHAVAEDDYGSVKLGGPREHSASAYVPPSEVQQTQFSTTAPPMFSDAMVPVDESIGFAATRPEDRILFRVGNSSGDIYGFEDGFTTLNAFVPLSFDSDRSLWWINPRVNITDAGDGTVSVGAGHRVYVPEDDRVYGASFWWDYDAGHAGTYNQLGGSFESIGRYVDLRMNFSIPIGDKETRQITGVGDSQFVGNQIAVQQFFTEEQAMQTYDAEVAIPFPGIGDFGVDLGVGIYYLSNSTNDNSVGVSVRSQAQISDNFWLNGLYTNDDTFGSNFSINFELTMPASGPVRWFRQRPVASSLTDSVVRRYRIPVFQTSGSEFVLATNPQGDPIDVAFIDPNLTVAGDGSAANPFMSIEDFMDEGAARSIFDIIFVRRRDDLTDTNLNTTIELLDFQTLIGDGTLPDGSRPQILTGQGTISLPGTDGPLPLLTNSAVPGTDVVTLANSNEVAGFTIDAGGTASGIVGTSIDSFSIHDNTIQNVHNGILITSVTGPNPPGAPRDYGFIANNIVMSTESGAMNAIPSHKGISVIHDAGELDLFVGMNTVTGFDEDANQNGMLDPDEDTNMNGMLDIGEDLDFDGFLDQSEDVNPNMMLDRGIGIEIVANGGTINANDPLADITTGVVGNVVSASGSGIVILADNPGTEINLAANDNSVTDGTDDNGVGILLRAEDMAVINLASFMGNSTDNNAGDGSVFANVNGGMVVTSTFGNNNFMNSQGDGLLIIADNTDVTIDDFNGFTFSGNIDDGLELRAVNGGTLTVTNPIVGSTFTNNGDFGVALVADGVGSEVDVLLGTIDPNGPVGNTFSGNGTVAGVDIDGGGVGIMAENGGTIRSAVVGNNLSNNMANGLFISANGAGSNVDLTGRSVLIPGFDALGNPIDITLNSVGVTNNTMSGNTNGMVVSASEGGVVESPFISNNNFSNNTEAGLVIAGNGSMGVDSEIDLGAITNNNFNRTTSGTVGILFDSEDVDITLGLTNNSFVGGGPINGGTNANTSFGIGGTIDGGGLNMSLVSPTLATQNTFTDNVDAHVGLNLIGDSDNTIEISNGVFNSATDDPGTPFFLGDGVAINLQDTAQLTGFVESSQFLNNAGSGLLINVTGNNDAGNQGDTIAAAVNNFVVGGPNPGDGNVFQSNGLDGFTARRSERGQFNNLLVEGNLFNLNGRNGIFVNPQNSDQVGLLNDMPDTVTINRNTITNNVEDGVEIRVEADADIVVNMDQNLIDGNGLNGIQVTENVDDDNDTRTVTGVWTRNQITNNDNDGIQLRGNFGNPLNDPSAGNGLLIGDATLNAIGTLSDMGNIISNNGQDGIDITQGGVVTIGNNVISLNGRLATATTPATTPFGTTNAFQVAGINIDGPEYEDGSVFVNGQDQTTVDDIVFGPFQDIRIISNLITQNNGDGIEYLAEGGIDSLGFTIDSLLFAQNNEITQNIGRGVDIMVRNGDIDNNDTDNVDPDTSGFVNNSIGGVNGDVTLIGNHIKGNRQEGVYIVTTNARDQSQAVGSNVTLSETGAVFQSNTLRLDVHDNDIIGNGNDVTDFPATGLVIRVGTTGGGFSAFFEGGFATSGFNPEDVDGDGVLDNDLNGDGFLNAADPFFGGVSASITNNFFDGNFGDDVLFHSFRSTVDPNTGTAWNAMMFNTTGYQSDPLSRLDLIFDSNTFNSVEMNNRDITIVTGGEPGAFYDNADGVFKSRTFNNNNPPLGGPFSQAGRRRNAQRLAFRYPNQNPQPGATPDNFGFLYPGLGDSTFRVRGVSNTFTDPALGTVTIDDIVVFDDPQLFNDPTRVDEFFEANGVFFTGVNFIGELPFGWGAF